MGEGYFPGGQFPDGYFPEGYFPDESTPAPAQPPGGVRFRLRAVRKRFHVVRIRSCDVNAEANFLIDKMIKDPGTQRSVEVSFYDQCASRWAANEDVSASEFTLPVMANGFSYEATVAGRTGSREPRWPTTAGLTIQDGSVTWTCRVPGSNALNTISDVAVVSDPAGITVSSIAISELFKVTAVYAGGTEGDDYDIVYTATINGRAVVARQRVEVRKQ